VDINQRLAPSHSTYTKVNDGGTYFADLGVGATYITTGNTLTITLSDNANGYVIADGVRVERLSPLHAEAAAVGQASDSASTLTSEAARPVINQAIAAWQLVDPRAASALSNVEIIVSDLPQTVLGLSSDVSSTIWLDVNGGGHGWQIDGAASPSGMDLFSVISHELGHVLGLADLDPTTYAGDLMASRLTVGTHNSPLGATSQSLTTLDLGQPLSNQASLSDSLFTSLGRGGLLSSLRLPSLDLLRSESELLDDEREDVSLLSDEFEREIDHVVADRKSLPKLPGKQRVDHEQELDELFAKVDELMGDFEAKLLEE